MRLLLVFIIGSCLSSAAEAHCGYSLRSKARVVQKVYRPAKVEYRVTEPAKVKKVEVQAAEYEVIQLPVRGRPLLERRIDRLQGRAGRAYARQASVAVVVRPQVWAFKARGS